MTKAKDREHLPAAIKREVRQRCGFGCVMCGSPIFDYEHISGYLVTGHDPDEMTLLCTMHHREKTAGRLPVSMVRRANAAPFNSSRSLGSRHDIYFEGPNFTISLGSTTFKCTDEIEAASAIEIDGETLLGLRFVEGRISLDITIRDKDNVPLLVVRGGELRHAVTSWDVTFEGRRLTIRRGPGDVVLALKLVPPGQIVLESAEIWCRGIFIRVGNASKVGDGIEIVNSGVGLSGGTFQGFKTLFALGDYLGLEGAALTTPINQRWMGGEPASPGTFSKSGGGQRIMYSNLPYLESLCTPTLSGSFMSDSQWGT